jgi:hypothetical protein
MERLHRPAAGSGPLGQIARRAAVRPIKDLNGLDIDEKPEPSVRTER